MFYCENGVVTELIEREAARSAAIRNDIPVSDRSSADLASIIRDTRANKRRAPYKKSFAPRCIVPKGCACSSNGTHHTSTCVRVSQHGRTFPRTFFESFRFVAVWDLITQPLHTAAGLIETEQTCLDASQSPRRTESAVIQRRKGLISVSFINRRLIVRASL